ncbi:MAG: YggT family protein [Holosporaceae bacterium]
MDIFFIPFLNIFRTLLSAYSWIIILGVALNWLIIFRVVNPYQPLVQHASYFYNAVTEPFYRHIRQFVPMIGGVDLTPLVLLLGISFFGMIVDRLILRLV